MFRKVKKSQEREREGEEIKKRRPETESTSMACMQHSLAAGSRQAQGRTD